MYLSIFYSGPTTNMTKDHPAKGIGPTTNTTKDHPAKGNNYIYKEGPSGT